MNLLGSLIILPLRRGTGAELGKVIAFSCYVLLLNVGESEGSPITSSKTIIPLGLWFMIQLSSKNMAFALTNTFCSHGL